MFTKPKNLIVQPSLAAHAVLTLDFPGLVSGFEADRHNHMSHFKKWINFTQ